MRVLIAEDDPLSRRLLEQTLSVFGYEVVPVEDGRHAWTAFQASCFPVVITDWEMPGMDGLELCRLIRESAQPAYTYIILVTVHRSTKSRVEGLSVGADDFVSKPFDPDELRARLLVAERIIKLETDLREANTRLQLKNLNLRKTSRLDPLMAIGNRLAFEEEISAFHQHAVERERPYSVVMCDVDHFKACNDVFGHQQGDKVLRGVAASIRASVREKDHAFRYGGEEVLIVLTDQDLCSATAVAERLRQGVQDTAILLGLGQRALHVTISCGVASLPCEASSDVAWRGLVGLADQALYEAKHRGRNCVIAAVQEPDGVIRFARAHHILSGVKELVEEQAGESPAPRPSDVPTL